ncbi:uncharacterized protein LOC111104809 isoform X2 [Crassostrea virginica]|uniref:Uncharacterized protein LOC111104809 isoform X2 n=1 Tax=Crassostrea virginica TaxID=6565 RepID=A0A8B8ATZ9_CRAVI|nr:uncharacterized protein LOC111104809 isoform X2 [Crassostrea virginica]
MTSHLKTFLILGVLYVVLIAIAVSDRKSMSSSQSSSTEIDNNNVERFKRNTQANDHKKTHDKSHKKDNKHKNHKKHHEAKNGTSTYKNESIYDSKKVDVNKKAEVVGGKMEASTHTKRVKVGKPKGGSNAGVIIAVIVILITGLGIGAAVFVIRKKKQSKESQ